MPQKYEKHEIYIITARKNNDEWFSETLKKDVEGITKKWLENNKIDYDEIFFDIKDKGECCKKHHIDVMIEDDPINIRKLINKTNIIIFDYPYNRNEEFRNLIRVHSWYDIYNKIKERK